jgi:hypothetical protein
MDIDLATLPDDVKTLQRMVRTLAIFDLNGEAKTATTKRRSPIIPPA